MENNKNRMQEYWQRNVRILLTLLGLWFAVSYVFGILLVDELNNFRLGGFKLGFWFAQQGAIYMFVLIIFLYVWLMNRLDHEFDVDED
jgi:putative solute:sodium symporter small subunit